MLGKRASSLNLFLSVLQCKGDPFFLPLHASQTQRLLPASFSDSVVWP